MTGQNIGSGSFDGAVDTLQRIIDHDHPVGSAAVGPKSSSVRRLVPPERPELYTETLNDVAKGLTADGEHPAWTDVDRVTGMHALGAFFMSFKDKSAALGEAGHFQYDRNDLETLLVTLQALKAK